MKVRARDLRVGDVVCYHGDDMIVPVDAEEVEGIEDWGGGEINVFFAAGAVNFELDTMVEVMDG